MCVFFLLRSSPAVVSSFDSFLAWLLFGLSEGGKQEEENDYYDKPGAHQYPAITNTLIKINSVGAMPRHRAYLFIQIIENGLRAAFSRKGSFYISSRLTPFISFPRPHPYP